MAIICKKECFFYNFFDVLNKFLSTIPPGFVGLLMYYFRHFHAGLQRFQPSGFMMFSISLIAIL